MLQRSCDRFVRRRDVPRCVHGCAQAGTPARPARPARGVRLRARAPAADAHSTRIYLWCTLGRTSIFFIDAQVRQMLVGRAAQRITIDGIRAHAWLAAGAAPEHAPPTAAAAARAPPRRSWMATQGPASLQARLRRRPGRALAGPSAGVAAAWCVIAPPRRRRAARAHGAPASTPAASHKRPSACLRMEGWSSTGGQACDGWRSCPRARNFVPVHMQTASRLGRCRAQLVVPGSERAAGGPAGAAGTLADGRGVSSSPGAPRGGGRSAARKSLARGPAGGHAPAGAPLAAGRGAAPGPEAVLALEARGASSAPVAQGPRAGNPGPALSAPAAAGAARGGGRPAPGDTPGAASPPAALGGLKSGPAGSGGNAGAPGAGARTPLKRSTDPGVLDLNANALLPSEGPGPGARPAVGARRASAAPGALRRLAPKAAGRPGAGDRTGR